MFNFFKQKSTESETNNPDLAERIFFYRPYQPYVKDCPDKAVKKACWNCKDIQDSLNKVIEVCGDPITPQARFLYAITYTCSRKKYNDKAIKYLTLYLENEPYSKEYGDTEERHNFHLYEMWRYLGQAYEKDYNLDKSLECYKKCLEYQKDFQGPYLDIANIYRKKNNLQTSLKLLNKTKETPYYKDDFKEVIDRYIIEYEEKIKRGYVYKPRKKEK